MVAVPAALKNTANGATPAKRLGTTPIEGSVMALAAPVTAVVAHGLGSTPPTLETLPVVVGGRTAGSVPGTVIPVVVAVVAVVLTLVKVGIFEVICTGEPLVTMKAPPGVVFTILRVN